MAQQVPQFFSNMRGVRRKHNTQRIKDVKVTTRETDYILTLIPTGDGVKNGNAYGVIRAILGIPQVK